MRASLTNLQSATAMNELRTLREWLASQAGERKLNEIARETGVSRRTIQRIVNDDGYSVNLKTFSTLDAIRVRCITESEQEAA